MPVESDGYDRPDPVIVSAFRDQPKYLDMGRVLAGGRLYQVRFAAIPKQHGGPVGVEVLGYMFVRDHSREVYVTPDTPNGVTTYPRLRWVGGFSGRMEAVCYLRAHRDVAAPWWAEAGEDMTR